MGEERGLVGRIRDFGAVQVGELLQLAKEVPMIDQSLLQNKIVMTAAISSLSI